MNYFAVVFEKKDHLIKKIPSLSELEKKTIIDFFKNHANLEGKIDWNKLDKLTYKDFEKVMIKNVKIKSGSAKEKVDYLEIDSLDKINKAFIPLTWEGSQYLASNAVGGFEGKWCISYRESIGHWNDYTKHSVFIVYITPTTKYAIQYDHDLNIKEVWDRWDKTIGAMTFLSETGTDVKELVNKNKRQLNISVEKILSNIFTIVDGSINVSDKKLTTLKGAPKEVKGDFRCSFNQLTSLKDVPEKVGGSFVCDYNKITSLKYSPKKIGKDFVCSYNQLISLEGSPERIGRDFDCRNNKLTSLKGAPKIVIGHFDCPKNKLTSLKGAPEKVDGDFDCRNNITKFTEDDVRAVCRVGGRIRV